MNRAKSMRRVRLLSSTGSPTCWLHTGQALAFALLEVAPAHDRPPRVAREHAPTRFHLIVEFGEACEACERAEELHDRLELPGVHVLAVAGDVPAARENESCPRRRVVEHRLGRSRRVPLDPPRNEHDEHTFAPCHCALDHLSVVRRSRNDGDAALEPVELPHALLSADAYHLVAPIERVLHHVPPELPRGSDGADLQRARPGSRRRHEARAATRSLTRLGLRAPAATPWRLASAPA
jgi:hypothetical protein